MKLKQIKETIKEWDDEMSVSQFIIRLKNLVGQNNLKGIKCWDCGTENPTTRVICKRCEGFL